MEDKTQILSRIKSHYHLKTDLELSKFLKIPATTLAAWRKRNHVDYEVIFQKCDKEVVYWILTGEEAPKIVEYKDLPDEQKKIVDAAPVGESILKQMFKNAEDLIAYLREDNERLKEENKKLRKNQEDQE